MTNKSKTNFFKMTDKLRKSFQNENPQKIEGEIQRAIRDIRKKSPDNSRY